VAGARNRHLACGGEESRDGIKEIGGRLRKFIPNLTCLRAFS
jgi:hypothetical protein